MRWNKLDRNAGKKEPLQNAFHFATAFLLPLGLTKPLVEPGVDKKALANKTSMLQSRWFGNRIRKEQGGFT
uniref:hypothetical protein n=1 Tax=Candidatus Fimivicinus sp. TaxID=3056640 RepID=UPI003FEDF514